MRGYVNANDYIISRTAAPSADPVTLAEAKDHLQLLGNDEDAVVLSMIKAATSYLDGPSGALGRALITQTWSLSVDRPCDNVIRLPLSPVQSISAISYYDTDDNSQNLDVADFRFYKSEDWAYIEPKSGVSWPTTISRRDAITVTFVAGYGSPLVLPQLLKQAVLLLVRHWYDNRSASSDIKLTDVPFAVESIVKMYALGAVV